jgi:quinol monooxygenase YgiN
MPRIACYADFTTKPEFTEQMVELFKTVIPATHKEPGVEQYIGAFEPESWTRSPSFSSCIVTIH